MSHSDEDPARDGFLARLTRKVMGGAWISEDLRRPPPFRIGRHAAEHRRAQARTVRTAATIALVIALGWVGLGVLEGRARLLVPLGWALFFLGYARFLVRLKRPAGARGSPAPDRREGGTPDVDSTRS